MTALIVDDNSGLRRLLRTTLSPVATLIWESANGLDGVQQYRLHRPDVVLMDVQMPRLDGFAATRSIIQMHPEARVIIVTDHDDDDLRMAAKEAGAFAYVGKMDLTGLESLLHSITG